MSTFKKPLSSLFNIEKKLPPVPLQHIKKKKTLDPLTLATPQ
jgi:hypothetical protein